MPCALGNRLSVLLVRGDFNGYYFKSDDANSLALKIRKLLSNPDHVELFGKRSYLIIENEVNIHTVIKEYVNAFNFVTKNEYLLKVAEPNN